MTLPENLDDQNYFHDNLMTLSLWPCWHTDGENRAGSLVWTQPTVLHSYALELKNKPVSIKSILEESLLILLHLKPGGWSLIFYVRKWERCMKKFGCNQSTRLLRGKAWLSWELNLPIFFMENASYLWGHEIPYIALPWGIPLECE